MELVPLVFISIRRAAVHSNREDFVWARGSAVGWGAYATSRKVAGSTHDEVIWFFNWPNPSSRTMALGSTQPLPEMSTRNLPGGKGSSARKADNLTAICGPIV
jgi:hypothetical protein